MSKIRSRIGKKHAKQAACTISAAALMLGVSEAATVGFNFQANYCYNAGYSGAVVIESFTQDVKVIARAAAIWRQIEPSREDIAAKGLAFLKKTLN